METFHLYHLASVWNDRDLVMSNIQQETIPSTDMAAVPQVNYIVTSRDGRQQAGSAASRGSIRAAAAHMVFAQRTSLDFITPGEVEIMEEWAGRATLECLANFEIPIEALHPEADSVWDRGLELSPPDERSTR